ncbi:MAG: Dna2/Cas4 domain-containing protein [Candidatus Thalassarchaeaceae archaeon]|nr:Dna2/Cas4 domain-containing protein [Candidatus Thalassarchaeaceae archaeon]
MGGDKSVEAAMNLSSPISEGNQRKDGYWANLKGVPLPVSASDLERHTYCPVSWQLSKAGVSGEGEAIEKGMVAHDKIHSKMQEFKRSEDHASRELVIWSWWITVLCALSADSAAFFFVGEGVIPEEFIQDMGRYLIMLAVVWLVLAIMLISLPWRRWLGRPFGLAQPPLIDSSGLQSEKMMSPFEPEYSTENDSDFGKGGVTEARLLLASIAVALHGLAIYWGQNRTILTFSLIVATLAWLLFTAWQLHRVLTSEREAGDAREDAGLAKDDILAYSDDAGESAALLVDEEIGVRGRPDQIVKIDNQFIPVEQKTGKIPKEPHDSHRMQLLAYLHLVSNTTGTIPDYGILRYGGEALFTVPWDDLARADLTNSIQEIQRLMVEGGAQRNHERPGKCRNCSRRKMCPQSLV